MSTNEQSKISLGSLITPARVLLAEDYPSKKELISALVQVVCRDYKQLDPADVAAQVLKREEGISTTLDTGLSIPHARLEELTDFAAAVAVLRKPLRETSGNELPIRVMFLFLSPAKPAFFQKHLQILSALAEKFKPEFIEELASLSNAEEVALRLAR
ncbi:PTS sugar transporter subunit IIA [Candidatus Avelusimicrobium gallicola]|uniref:PTS EIIA type-2 domain-containing protein n=1 Tax=Candidatus Avelusimicrobium gallicola TaxID=2562704 RepID=A0A1Y4DEI3_9BACT|nr:PTS sugar transporter subunit IIA [Elusimicrobium sp. An273]OUO56119.1 hypothetical protein B5F75_05725 [Elusimicrobium sp. An273]